jgi:hypothetical protein
MEGVATGLAIEGRHSRDGRREGGLRGWRCKAACTAASAALIRGLGEDDGAAEAYFLPRLSCPVSPARSRCLFQAPAAASPRPRSPAFGVIGCLGRAGTRGTSSSGSRWRRRTGTFGTAPSATPSPRRARTVPLSPLGTRIRRATSTRGARSSLATVGGAASDAGSWAADEASPARDGRGCNAL